jgi:hypothetical protein
MNLLRAHIRAAQDWWEVRLLDLDIVADGATEAEMIQQLEHALVSEYHLALKAGRTPFLNVLLAVPTGAQGARAGADALRVLKLPQEVAIALAGALRAPQIGDFALDRSAA